VVVVYVLFLKLKQVINFLTGVCIFIFCLKLHLTQNISCIKIMKYNKGFKENTKSAVLLN